MLDLGLVFFYKKILKVFPIYFYVKHVSAGGGGNFVP